jgi:hypothetical protein
MQASSRPLSILTTLFLGRYAVQKDSLTRTTCRASAQTATTRRDRKIRRRYSNGEENADK